MYLDHFSFVLISGLVANVALAVDVPEENLKKLFDSAGYLCACSNVTFDTPISCKKEDQTKNGSSAQAARIDGVCKNIRDIFDIVGLASPTGVTPTGLPADTARTTPKEDSDKPGGTLKGGSDKPGGTPDTTTTTPPTKTTTPPRDVPNKMTIKENTTTIAPPTPSAGLTPTGFSATTARTTPKGGSDKPGGTPDTTTTTPPTKTTTPPRDVPNKMTIKENTTTIAPSTPSAGLTPTGFYATTARTTPKEDSDKPGTTLKGGSDKPGGTPDTTTTTPPTKTNNSTPPINVPNKNNSKENTATNSGHLTIDPPKKETKMYALPTLLAILFCSFGAGIIFAVAGKLAYDRYRKRSYVIPPEQGMQL